MRVLQPAPFMNAGVCHSCCGRISVAMSCAFKLIARDLFVASFGWHLVCLRDHLGNHCYVLWTVDCVREAGVCFCSFVLWKVPWLSTYSRVEISCEAY